MPINHIHTPEIKRLLSESRLTALRKWADSDESAIALHQEILNLDTSLMGIIGAVEISLRNAVAHNLTAYFGSTEWLQNPSPLIKWQELELSQIGSADSRAREAKHAKFSNEEKKALDALVFPDGPPRGLSQDERVKARKQQIIITHENIIAAQTLFFWKRLYGKDYERSLWKPTLKNTFPDSGLSRSQIASRIEVVYKIRNRLAHHERVVPGNRFWRVIKAVKFISHNLRADPASPEGALIDLLGGDIDRICQREKELRARLRGKN